MKYLMDYNITEADLNEILQSIDYEDQVDLATHEESVREIIEYLKSKNINNIKDILIHNIEVFYTSRKYIQNTIDNLDPETLKELSEDSSIFNEIFNE